MPIIYVSRRGNSTNLRLRDDDPATDPGNHNPGDDNLTTYVDAGNTVTWMKDPNAETNPNANPPTPLPGYSPIGSIVNVVGMLEDPGPPVKYPGSQQLFATGPSVSGGVATATLVSPSPGQGRFENYKIYYTLPNDPQTYSDDPQLKMR